MPLSVPYPDKAERAPSWWGSDFIVKNGRLIIPGTGANIPFDGQLIADICRWMTYYALVRLKSLLNLLAMRRGPRLFFTPVEPRPWYIIWAAAMWGGMSVAPDLKHADAAFYFEDQTWGQTPDISHAKRFNFQCTDVSKGRVAAVFEQVFGYGLAIDPETFVGQAVEKSEINGKHDGRVIQCPAPRRKGLAYQRFIDTTINGVARDLRTPCVNGQPVIVMIKLKPANESFSIQNDSVHAASVTEIFSAEEIGLIARFNKAMGMDWGSLDILRETATGKLFIVDANKTDTGPPVVLSWKDRVRVTSALASALRAMIDAKP